MKKIKTFLISILFMFIFCGYAVAGTGEATEYKINIYKIELCDDTSSASACNGAVTIYNGSSGDIDIANTTAGAAAASLGNLGKAEFKKSYSYLQITMGRAFTVKGSAADGSGTTCYTKSNGSAGTLAKGSEESGDEASATLYAAMVGTSVGDNLTGLTSLTDTTGVASTIASDDEYFQYRQALSKTFTMEPGNIPTMKIAFGTSAALGAIDDMGDSCETVGAAKGLYAAEPDVTVTIE